LSLLRLLCAVVVVFAGGCSAASEPAAELNHPGPDWPASSKDVCGLLERDELRTLVGVGFQEGRNPEDEATASPVNVTGMTFCRFVSLEEEEASAHISVGVASVFVPEIFEQYKDNAPGDLKPVDGVGDEAVINERGTTLAVRKADKVVGVHVFLDSDYTAEYARRVAAMALDRL
jgi:hypothetical protein